ncbi:MAG: outer membrane lipoprotein-sorting protein [Deltaproteobacteria bacterium]|nr:outer membrane lipoprotein-sorting protein [Deltaproteobacteria bacterium]
MIPHARTLALLAAVASSPAAAQELTAQQILDRALTRNAFGLDNAKASITMRLTSKRGSERERKVSIKSRQTGGLGKTLVRFHAPADIAGTGFLVLENNDRDDDQYLFLPNLGKVKRIATSQRNDKFMGTDLTYADLEYRDLKDAALTRLADAEANGRQVYVIEAVPQGDKSEYGKVTASIDKEAFVAVRLAFFDKEQKLLKTMNVHELEQRDGRWLVREVAIESTAGSKTFMRIDEVDFNAKMSDHEFSERALAGG